MRNNEKGFTFPLTLTITLLFLIIFSYRLEQLVTERRLSHETAIIIQQEYYYHSSVKKLEKVLQSGGTIQPKGSYSFTNAHIAYQTENLIGTTQRINFTLTMASGETSSYRGIFDLHLKKLVKWIELQ
ncbi:competence type IV pilus minor pilin ComGG [Bacillus sp. MRMR6]|uniref:competence type IV pilus minor pilin ComGG n=1 Tax=Bacillus sp. MRMR6 TaxID=1928617 RepID=UPI000952BC30|nr:competence type IV pilus minor pilin ComGG [Bacillus sp. MRMR6]OLS41704.1 hypothetical protein BTR25_03925 [Bacillus sp. MRMR6]